MALVVHGDQAAEPPPVISTVPAAAGSRLHFHWGAGQQLSVCETLDATTGAGGSEPSTSRVSW